MTLAKIQSVAKAVVAVAGFLVVAGGMVVSGHFDGDSLLAAGVALGVALGVYRVPNKA